jgi:hypothetical protein
MKHLIRLLLHNAPLKLSAFIIAYALWASLSATREREKIVKVPVCFFGSDQEYIVNAPETLRITLKGTRDALHAIDYDSIAVHINSVRIPDGTHEKVLHSADLFLPPHVKLLHYEPSNFLITKTSSLDTTHA